MQNRTSIADILKGIAIVFMIQVHVLEIFATNSIFSSKIGQISLFLGGPVVAPIFSIIFGYFIAVSKQNTRQLILRGIKLFLLGLLLNIALNLNLFISIYNKSLQANPYQYLFGVDFLLYAGLAIVLLAVLKKLILKNPAITVALCLTVSFCGQAFLELPNKTQIINYFTSFFYGSNYWSYFPIFPWFAYPLVGFLIFQWKSKVDLQILLETKYRLLIYCAFVIFLFFTVKYGIQTASNLQEYYHHGIQFFIWTIIFLLFYFLLIFQTIPLLENTQLIKYLKWLGKNVTVIYCIQWVIIGNIGTSIYKTIDKPMILILSFFGILFTTSIATYLFLKIKKADT